MLTNNLDVDAGRVLDIFNLHLQAVLPRILAFGLANEEDGVSLAVSHAHLFGVQGLPLLEPGHLGFGLPLDTREQAGRRNQKYVV